MSETADVTTRSGARASTGPTHGCFRGGGYGRTLEMLATALSTPDRIAVVTGAPGVGKTTLCRTLALELGADLDVTRLNGALLRDRATLDAALARAATRGDATPESAQRAVLVDDADGLDRAALTYLLELAGRSGMALALFGRPILSQRVRKGAASGSPLLDIRIAPLTEQDAAEYLAWRMADADGATTVRLSAAQAQSIIRQAGGLPGRIDELAEGMSAPGGVNRARTWRTATLTALSALAAALAVAFVVLSSAERTPIGTAARPAAPPESPAAATAQAPPGRPEPSATAPAQAAARPATESPDAAVLPADAEAARDIDGRAVSTSTDRAPELAGQADGTAATAAGATPGATPPSGNDVPAGDAAPAVDQQAMEDEPVPKPDAAAVSEAIEGPEELAKAESVTETAAAAEGDTGAETAEAAEGETGAEAEEAAGVEAIAEQPEPTAAPLDPIEWLFEQPPSNFTLQIAVVSSAANAESFVRRQRSRNGYVFYPIQHRGERRFVILRGSYPNRAAAERAAAELPPTAGMPAPWIRRMAEVQAVARGSHGI